MKISNILSTPLSIVDGAKNAVEDTARQVVNGAGDLFDTAKDLASTVGMIDVKPGTVAGSAEHLLGIGGDSRSKLIDDTRDLRNQAANIRALQAKLGGMKPGDP